MLDVRSNFLLCLKFSQVEALTITSDYNFVVDN